LGAKIERTRTVSHEKLTKEESTMKEPDYPSVLYLPAPEARLKPDALDDEQLAELNTVFAIVEQLTPHTSNGDAVAIVDAALRRLGAVDAPDAPAIERANTSLKALEVEYDQYFNVIRADSNPRHLLFSQLVAYRALLIEAEVGHSLAPAEWSLLRLAFNELAAQFRDTFDARKEEAPCTE
jgi:hypothetical protein